MNLDLNGFYPIVAGQHWLSATFNLDITNEQVKKIRKDLKLYCRRDTESMVWILNKLKEQIK